MSDEYGISIIIPAYNEEESISKVIEYLLSLNKNYEVIVVNDGSTDKTRQEVSNFPCVKLINHPYNKGYGASLKTGVRRASNDYILTIDADGQHRPADILRLLEHIETFDMIVGSREGNTNQDWIRKPGKWVLSWVANYLSNMKIPDINSGLRLIRKHCIEEFLHILPNGFSFSTTLTLAVINAGYNVKYVPISVVKRMGGKSRVKQVHDGFATLLLITRCISLFNPLKIFAPVAGVIFAFSIPFSLYGIIHYHSFPKTGILTFLSGILILLFGILADQVAAIRRGIH
jgi:glycosyltransferase involved in cell wall biosynthesis